jgi:hypothetical protein
MLRAAATPAVARLLAASAATGMSHTGNTNETALATVTIPAGAMGLNGGLHIYTSWAYTNSGNGKTLRVRFGGVSGTSYLSSAPTTTASLSDMRRIRNRNSASSQVGGSANVSNPLISQTTAIVTSSVDTSAAVDVVISGQLASAGETITLENYEVWLLP